MLVRLASGFVALAALTSAAALLAPSAALARPGAAPAPPIIVRHVVHPRAPRALVGVHGLLGLATAPSLEPSKLGVGLDAAYELSPALALQGVVDVGLDTPLDSYWRLAAGVRLQWPDARVVVPYLAFSAVVGTESTGWIDGPMWRWTPIVAVAPELGIEVRPTSGFFVRASTRVDTVVSFGTAACTGEAEQCAMPDRPAAATLFVGLGLGARL